MSMGMGRNTDTGTATRTAVPATGAGGVSPHRSDLPRPVWGDMPEGKERTRQSMLWNCDEWHRQGRTDLARALSDGFKLGWSPAQGYRQANQNQSYQTTALPLGESASETSLSNADYNPFAP